MRTAPHRRRPRTGALASVPLAPALVLALLAAGAAAPAPAQQDEPSYELRTNVRDGFTLTAVGDLIIAYPHMDNPDPGFRAVVELVRRGDVAFGNFEISTLDFRRFRSDGSGRFSGRPEVARDVAAMGFDVVARANNHLEDFGVEGILETNRALEEAGLVYAGSGRTHGLARAPRYLSTPKGRVGLVAMSSSFSGTARSLPERGAAPGRAGLSALGTTRYFVGDEEVMDAARVIREAFPTGGGLYPPTGESGNRIQILDEWFTTDDGPTPRYSYEMNPDDLDEILASVRIGKVNSDFLVVAIHAHQTTGTEEVHRDPSIPDFLPELARAAIDNGADAFLGSGVHVLRGIEVYRGRPIFYGLGEFYRQMDTPLGPYTGDDRIPERPLRNSPAVKYESVVAESRFEDDRLAEIRLHPIDLGHEKRFANRGVPYRAGPETSRRILERLQDLSEPLGTRIEIEGDVGVIRVTEE